MLKAAVLGVSAGVAHLDEDRAYELVSGGLPESAADLAREHAARCAACAALVRDAVRFHGSFQDASAPSRLPHPWKVLALAASVILVLGSIWVMARGPRIPEVNIVKAAYVPASDEILLRGGEPSRLVDPFTIAMQPYESGDLAGAEVELAALLAKDPNDVRAHFYRGVSLLLLDRSSEGISELVQAARQPGERQAEARFYLALAYLRAKSARDAIPILAQLASVAGPHREEAAALLERMR